MSKDVAFGCAALGLAVGYYMLAAAIPTSALSDAVGPGGLPAIYALVLGGLSLILIAQGIIRSRMGRPARPDPEQQARRRQELRRVAGLLGIGAFYVFALPWLGYVLSLAGLIAATTYFQGGSANRQVAGVALGGAAFFWLLFVKLLGIPQPAGFWPSLL